MNAIDGNEHAALMDPDTLAGIANDAVSSMFGLPLEIVDTGDAVGDNLTQSGRHAVMLRLHGSPAIFLGLSCDHNAAAVLASIIFDAPQGAVDRAMIEDALRELANIVAGQVKSFVCPEHHIGLPRIQTDPATLGGLDWHGVTFRVGDGDGRLDLAVAA